MNRFWHDAAAILETASSASAAEQSEIVILVDDQEGIRIVDGSGCQVDALREEYAASTAYHVKRSATGVTVDARNDHESCTLKKSTTVNPFANLSEIPPRHLIAGPGSASDNLIGDTPPGHMSNDTRDSVEFGESVVPRLSIEG